MRLVLGLLAAGICFGQGIGSNNCIQLTSDAKDAATCNWQAKTHPPQNLNLWKASVVALVASSALDTASSWGGQELNPILGKGQFGIRQAGIKTGIVGSVVLTEWLWLHKHPETQKVFVNLNVGSSALVVGVAINNFKVVRSK